MKISYIQKEAKTNLESMFESVINELDYSEIDYNMTVIEDIGEHGAFAIEFHCEIDIDELPDSLVELCDEIQVKSWGIYPKLKARNSAIEKILYKIYNI